VPDVEAPDVVDARHVADDPLHSTRPVAEPPPRHPQTGLGDVEHGDALEVDQVVHQ
jgi:hypothetical protein